MGEFLNIAPAIEGAVNLFHVRPSMPHRGGAFFADQVEILKT
jgi:hypothetical protein